MSTKCPSCNSTDLTSVGQIHAAEILDNVEGDTNFTEAELLRCKTCNLNFRWPHLDEKQLHDFYDNLNIDHWKYNRYRKDWKITADWIKEKIENGSVLDVGCWDGEFLNYLGKDWQLNGIELNPAAVDKAISRKVKIVGRDFRDISKLDSKFDVTTAFDFIEHVKNPSELISLMSQVTKTGGYIVISSGNTDTPTWNICKSKYWYCSISLHLSFINPNWCKFTAEKFNLKVEKVERFCHAQGSLFSFYSDLLKNSIYLTVPSLLTLIRKVKHFRSNRKGSYTSPPLWRSSKDHFITIYKKL